MLHITSSDNLLDVTNLYVEVQNITTGVNHQITIDSSGDGIIYIPIGEQYKIVLPDAQPYITTTYEMTFVAEKYFRNIYVNYRHTYDGYDDVAKSIIINPNNLPAIETGGSDEVLNRIIYSGNLPGTYVIDEVHKSFAKLKDTDHTRFDDDAPYNGMYGNVFKHFPKIYLVKDSNYSGAGVKYYISDINITAEEFPITLPESWVGTYLGNLTNGILYSRPNVAVSGCSIATAQAGAKANGSYYGILDYKDRQKISLLFLATTGTTNVDVSDAGEGLSESSSSSSTFLNAPTGITAEIGDSTGKTPYQGYYQCKFLGIEALWGQRREFVKGIYVDNITAKVYSANSIEGTETPERAFNIEINKTNSYIKSLVNNNYFDILPTETGTAGTSSSTYYCDAVWSNSQNTLGMAVTFGGHSGTGKAAGIFSCHYRDSISSTSGTETCGRLCFYGNINDYTLLTGAELAALNN